nr:reverse transcriptase domain-containing protein [Tanacetum cinerariifolium]
MMTSDQFFGLERTILMITSYQQTSAVTTAMTSILKQFQATPPPASVKVFEEICVTCGGAHPYYQYLSADGNTFLELRDNIQGYVAAAAVNYNQGNSGYRPLGVANQIRQSGFAQPNKMLKALLSNREKLLELINTPLNENFSAVILKKLLEKLGDPGKFLISYGFSELKCKALADLSASINLMPLSVWKKLGLPELISTRMTLKLANRAICTPAGIARDVFIPVGKFTFLADFVIVDYESDHRVPLILGRPFLRTARDLIDVHRDEMILCDEGGNVLTEKLLDLDSTKDPREKLLNINLLLPKIKFLNDNHTPDHVLKPSSPFYIPVKDSDSFLEKSDTSLSYSNNSLPEYETFSNHTEETNSGSTTTHANYSLPKVFETEGPLVSMLVSVGCQKPGHLAASLGCAETKVVTWDDLAFKLITLGVEREA